MHHNKTRFQFNSELKIHQTDSNRYFYSLVKKNKLIKTWTRCFSKFQGFYTAYEIIPDNMLMKGDEVLAIPNRCKKYVTAIYEKQETILGEKKYIVMDQNKSFRIGFYNIMIKNDTPIIDRVLNMLKKFD